MVTSQRMKQRKEFYNVSNNELRSFFGLAKKEGKGTDVSVFYRRRDYDKILDYITSEFNLEILYILLRRHIHAKGTMDQ